MSSRKQKELVKAYYENNLGRRELLQRMAQLGVGAAATAVLLNATATDALAAEGPDFKKFPRFP